MFSLKDQKIKTPFYIYLVAAAVTGESCTTVARSFLIRARTRAEAIGLFQLEAPKSGFQVISWQIRDLTEDCITVLLYESREKEHASIVCGEFVNPKPVEKKPFFPIQRTELDR